MIWVTAGTAVIAILAIGLGIWDFKRRQEIKNYYRAAERILKEEYLDHALKQNGGTENGNDLRLMICLKSVRGRKGCFVFDPDQVISLGRSSKGNSLRLRDEHVSGFHCRIFRYGEGMFLEDAGSRNGTFLRSGFRKQQVFGPCQIFSGDRIYLGDQKLKVILFSFDTMLL